MVDAVADTGLGRQIDDNSGAVLLKHLLQQSLIREIAPDEDVAYRAFFRDCLDLGKTPFLQTDLIIIVHTVKADDGSARELPQKADHKIRTDEAGRARDQDGFVVQINVCFHSVRPL